MLGGQPQFTLALLTYTGLGVCSNNAGQLPPEAVRQVC